MRYTDSFAKHCLIRYSKTGIFEDTHAIFIIERQKNNESGGNKTMLSIQRMLSVVALFGALAVPMAVTADDAKMIEEGKQISFDKKKGNCLACHMIMGGDMPGNIGPPLIAMKARFPDAAKLRDQIADPRGANPNSIMPPFGAHGILTDDELDKVVAYVHSL